MEQGQFDSTEICRALRKIAPDEKIIYTNKGTPIPIKRAWIVRKWIGIKNRIRGKALED